MRYMYEELLNKALAHPISENLEALVELCYMYGNCWNGECYDISDIGAPSGSRSLYPVFGEPAEDGIIEIIGYEIH